MVKIETEESISNNEISEMTNDNNNPQNQIENKEETEKLFLNITKMFLIFQVIFGLTYGGSICTYISNSQSSLKFKRFLLILYELILSMIISVNYLFFNQSDQMFEMNAKKPAMKILLKIGQYLYIITFVVHKLVFMINGSSILKTIMKFEESNIKAKVNSIK